MQEKEQSQQERVNLPESTEEQPVSEVEEPSPGLPTKEEEGLRSVEQQKADEYLDLLRRSQADFINYRRRMSQELAEARNAAQVALLNQLLPVLDDLGRALAAAPADLAKDSWVQGLFLVARRMSAQLESLGIQSVGVSGELFDPRKHEAITVEEHSDVPEGTIVQVIRPGYMLGERIIRPAQVIVAGTTAPVGGSST